MAINQSIANGDAAAGAQNVSVCFFIHLKLLLSRFRRNPTFELSFHEQLLTNSSLSIPFGSLDKPSRI